MKIRNVLDDVMSEMKLNEQDNSKRLSSTPRIHEGRGDDSRGTVICPTGKVKIDQYIEALRKGITLSQ